jgi:heme-degrading monooxygenase HmoA
MILEIATIDIHVGKNGEFEQQLEKAQGVLRQAKGYIEHQFQHCVEMPNRYVLLIRWETLEDHTIGFRESALFVQWRGFIGSYFAQPPVVQHFILKF